jgi:hypothetical protein
VTHPLCLLWVVNWTSKGQIMQNVKRVKRSNMNCIKIFWSPSYTKDGQVATTNLWPMPFALNVKGTLICTRFSHESYMRCQPLVPKARCQPNQYTFIMPTILCTSCIKIGTSHQWQEWDKRPTKPRRLFFLFLNFFRGLWYKVKAWRWGNPKK